MATFIPALHCVLVEILGMQDGQSCEMTIGAQHTGAYILSDLVDLAGAVDGWFNADFLSLIGTGAFYEGVTVRGLDSEDDIRYDLSEPLEGTNGGAALPANVAVCATKRTGFTGRSNRGRMYAWGVPEGAQLDQRHLTSTFVGAYNTSFDQLLTAIVAASFEPVVISYYHNGAARTTAQVRGITALELNDNRLDTQRRRLGRGA